MHCSVSGKKPQGVVRARILDDDAAYALAALVKEDQDGATVQVTAVCCKSLFSCKSLLNSKH